jgi:hypothetical protein
MRTFQRSSRRATVATALVALSALALPASAAAAHAVPAACSPALRKAVLPVWARGGYSESKPISQQILGRSGDILAIPFADPLVSPPSSHYNNKILWVSRVAVKPLGSLQIAAQRMVGTRNVGSPVSRVVQGGPGPSIINLPAAGCWRLSLHWSGRSDSLDVHYVPRIS